MAFFSQHKQINFLPFPAWLCGPTSLLLGGSRHETNHCPPFRTNFKWTPLCLQPQSTECGQRSINLNNLTSIKPLSTKPPIFKQNLSSIFSTTPLPAWWQVCFLHPCTMRSSDNVNHPGSNQTKCVTSKAPNRPSPHKSCSCKARVKRCSGNEPGHPTRQMRTVKHTRLGQWMTPETDRGYLVRHQYSCTLQP